MVFCLDGHQWDQNLDLSETLRCWVHSDFAPMVALEVDVLLWGSDAGLWVNAEEHGDLVGLCRLSEFLVDGRGNPELLDGICYKAPTCLIGH